MARGLNLLVNIGAKLAPSFAAAASAGERRMQQMVRNMNRRAAEVRAVWAGAERRVGSFGSVARDAVYSVGAPMAALSAMGMRAAYEWSVVGNELQSVTQMSARARKGIEDVARSIPGNPTENLSAALDLARTGFSEKAIMGTLGVTLKLGRADNSVDQAQAADIMTNVMTGMGLYKDSMTTAQIKANSERVANNLAIGAARSSSDIRLMGESFKYAAPLASRLGIEIEDLTAWFMMMADNGIKGSEAGVALRSGMVRMLKPTKSMMAVMGRLGMSIGDYVTSTNRPTGRTVVESLKAQGIAAEGARAQIDRLLATPGLSGGDLVAKISQAVADGMNGGADAADLDKISDGVAGAIMAGASKVDFAKFLEDFTKRGGTIGDLTNILDVRQGARLVTLTDGSFERRRREVAALSRMAEGRGTFLDKMYAMQMQGAVDPWMKMQQGMGNLMISMAESGAMDAVADGMNAMAKAMMSLSKTSPGMLKFITLSILGLGLLAPLGLVISGLGAAFRLLAFPVGLANLALGKIAPRLVTTRIAMVGARYGIRAAVFEIIKDLMLLPVRAGAALGRVRGVFAAARAMGAGASVAQVGGGVAARVAASPVAGAVVRGVTTVGPTLLSMATGWGGLIVRGLLVGMAGIGSVLAGITAPVWGLIALIAAAFVGVGLFIMRNWQGIGVYFSNLWQSFSQKTAPLRQSLSQLGTSLANLGTALMGWLGRVGSQFLGAVGRFFAPAIAQLKQMWMGVAPIIVPVVAAIGAAIRGVIGWIKAAIAWVANLLAPVALEKWKAWGNAIGGAIGGVVNKLKGFVDWVRKGVDGMTTLLNNSAQPTVGAKAAPGPKLAGKRASGGPVIGSRLYLVGERGPELFRAPESGKIIPANDTARILAGGGGKVTSIDAGRGTRQASGGSSAQPITINIYGATDPEATAREVERTLRRMGRGQSSLLSD